MSYWAANGMEIKDAMIDRWCESYERGEFPDGERSTGRVVMGRPPLSSDRTETLTASAYARSVLADDLLAVS